MSWQNVRLEHEGAVATIVLDRPEALNAFDGTMREDLHGALVEAARTARVIVLTGRGRAFSAGGDVAAMAALRRRGEAAPLRDRIRAGRRIVELFDRLEMPTIAAVNGVAAGAGLSLALLCDLRIASDRARLGASFVRVGLHPDWAATYTLPRLVGPAVAREMIFTGRLLDADEALRVGLVNRVVPHDELGRVVGALAAELAAGPPVALRRAKEALRRVEGGASLAEILEYEERAQLACFGTEDALEGLSAFEEKRPARFRGR